MILSAFNPSTKNLEKTYLSNDYAVGTTSIVVRNSNNMATNSRILLGTMGSENAEIVTVSNVNADGVTITVGATKYPHTRSDPVFVLTYDQIKFYRSTTTVDGTYNSLATIAIDVDNDTLKTFYTDATGLTSYFYKISFYHSIAAVESDLSDPIPGEGYGRKQVGTLVNEFLQEIGDIAQEYITVPQILGLLNECNEDIIGQSRRPYRFLRKSVLATITADVDSINLTTIAPDLIRFDRMKYTNDTLPSSETVGLVPMVSIQEMEYYKYDESAVIPPLPNGVSIGAIDDVDDVVSVILYPTPATTQTNKIKVYYWGDFDYIDSLADTLQTPVKRIYKLFLLGRFYRIRAKKEASFLNLSDRYLNDYTTEVVKLQRTYKVDIGSPMSFRNDTRTTRGLRRR